MTVHVEIVRVRNVLGEEVIRCRMERRLRENFSYSSTEVIRVSLS